MALECHVRPVVRDALRIMGPCPLLTGLRVGEAAGELRLRRISYVDHVECTLAVFSFAANAHRVSIARRLIDDHVVSGGKRVYRAVS